MSAKLMASGRKSVWIIAVGWILCFQLWSCIDDQSASNYGMQIKYDEWEEVSVTYSHIDTNTGELARSVWGTSDPKLLGDLRSSLHMVDIQMAWSLSPSTLTRIDIRTSRHNYIGYLHHIGEHSMSFVFYYDINSVVRSFITPDFKASLERMIQSSTGHRPIFVLKN